MGELGILKPRLSRSIALDGSIGHFFPLNITTLHHTILGSSQIKDSIPLDTSTCGD